MRTKWIQVLMVAVTTATAGAALAEPSASGAVDDRSFVAQALATNRLELALGRLALERAVTATVQNMGRKMVEKHTALGQRLSDLAVEVGAAPADSATSDATVLSRLGATPSDAFDDAFVRTIDDIHRHELALYEEEAKRSTRAGLHALAVERVAALRKSVAERRQQQKDW